MAPPDAELTVAGAGADPFALFEQWFAAARQAVPLAEAMALATVGPDGRPSARMVLLKAWGPDGYVFYTNYDSRKGQDLAVRPDAAVVFHWQPLERQVRIEGSVGVVHTDESDAYFATRPRGAQLGAHASDQSRPIDDRSELEARVTTVAARFDGQPVPRPANWGGYRLVPERFEFWQGRSDRLHDRVAFQREGPGEPWSVTRLQP